MSDDLPFDPTLFRIAQAEFHKRIAKYMPRRDQGVIMDDFREVLSRVMRQQQFQKRRGD